MSNNNVPGKSSDEEKKEKKRKVSDPLWPKKKEDELVLLESSSNESTPLGTPKEISDLRDSLPGIEFTSLADLGVSSVDKSEGFDMDEDVMEVNDLDDVEEFLKLSAKKIKKTKEPGLKLDDKSLQPAVNLSPLQSSSFSISGVNLERRPGIEIIPIANADTLGRPLTETEQLRNERKIKSKSLEEKARLEKKRKRKRDDDSPMGPPEKPAKLDSSSKPSGSSSKSDPSLARKYSPSPIPFSSSGKSSPSNNNNNNKVLSKPPGSYSSSSPKNNVLSSSPKHHSSVSPKQTSSGKPSMSALKSAVTSPTSSSKSDSSKSKSSSKDFQSGREKDKKLSSSSSGNSSHSSPKLKPPTVKMKPDTVDNLEFDPSKGDPSQMRKKGSLSAVIDKLKSAQHGGDPGGGDGGGKASEGKVASSSSKSELSSKTPGEYQVKHSPDGMKITIGKTKTLGQKIAKPSSSSPKFTGLKPGVISGPASKKSSTLSSSSSSSSKPPTLTSSSSSSTGGSSSSSSKISGSSSVTSSSTSTSSSSSKLSSSSSKSSSPSISTKSNFKTSSSSGNSSSSLSKTSSSSSDPNKQRDKLKLSSKSSSGSSSPCLSSSDREKSKKSGDEYKSNVLLSSQHVVEGLIKQLDTKFQIPKLSARSLDNPTTTSITSSSDVKKQEPKPSDSKSSDLLPSKTLDPGSKYPLVVASPLKFEEKLMEGVKSSSRSLTSSPVQCSSPTKFSSKSCDATSFEEKMNPSATSDVFKSLKMDLPISSISFSDADIKKPLPLANAKLLEKPQGKTGTTSQEAAEILLDFSSATQATKPPDTGGKVLKQPPSQVSLHIVKSPVPSPNPKIVNSPSPACIDDDMVDENFVGIGQ